MDCLMNDTDLDSLLPVSIPLLHLLLVEVQYSPQRVQLVLVMTSDPLHGPFLITQYALHHYLSAHIHMRAYTFSPGSLVL